MCSIIDITVFTIKASANFDKSMLSIHGHAGLTSCMVITYSCYFTPGPSWQALPPAGVS